MRKRIFSTLLLFSFLAACASPTPMPAPVDQASVTPEAAEPERDWWRTAVFYEIFVRSYYDTDGNGIGDFNGITAKLDYLQDLGIDAIWLMPIHPSPSYHGYDVLNYYNVNPDYGSMADFKNLLAEAHKRDIRIIIDLVINHTSSQHPWFRDADANLDSAYRNFYVWSDSPGAGNWHQGQNGYYYGFFWSGMPDLNYTNPAVTEAIFKINDFWLNEIGVDGFRLDAVKHLIEEDGKLENTPATHAWLREYYQTYKAVNPQAYTIGEVYGAGSSVIKQYTGTELDHIFNFEMSSGIVNSINGGSNTGITSAFKFAFMDTPDFNYATFLTNHDQNRVMSVFNGNIDKAKTAATLLLTMPGTPYLYFGEEIGMTGKKPDEDIRVPMQWSNAENAGFTSGVPWRAINSDYETVNVDLQLKDPDSLLNHYKTLIQLRKTHSALLNGNAVLVKTGSTAVYALLRSYGDEHILILANLTDEPVTDYKLTLEEALFADGSLSPEALFGNTQPAAITIKDGRFTEYQPLPELAPYQTLVLLLK